MAWETPKTDWNIKDRFNISDYNRIKNNISYIYNEVQRYFRTFDIQNMGDDILDYSSYWDVDNFNAFEENLEIINAHAISFDIGTKQTFFENAPFISASELNRLESALLRLKTLVDNIEISRHRLAFRLGQFKL